MGLIHDGKHFEGHFNIIEGQQTWWVGSILDANHFEGHEGSSKVSEMLGAMGLKISGRVKNGLT